MKVLAGAFAGLYGQWWHQQHIQILAGSLKPDSHPLSHLRLQRKEKEVSGFLGTALGLGLAENS